MAEQLWRLLGFADQRRRRRSPSPRPTSRRCELSADLVKLGILSDDSQAALVRTWGRSFARLAEWETTLLANVAGADEPTRRRG